MSKETLEGLNLTKDEVKRLQDAMQKEEFVKLFQEYMNEISDPKHKEETEQYLKQVEREQEEATKSGNAPQIRILVPKAEFCIKTMTKDDTPKKIFINICSSDKVEKLQEKQDKEKGGTYYSVPFTIGKERGDLDNETKSCVVFDIVFHDETVKRAENPRFKDFLCTLAVENLAKQKNLKLNKKYKLLNIKSKGTPAAQTYKSQEQTKSSSTSSPASTGKNPVDQKLEQSLMEMYEETLRKQQPKSNLISEVSNSPTFFKPSFLIIHSGTFDMSEFTTQRVSYVNHSVPKNLLVKVTLPKVTSAATVELDFTDRKLFLKENSMNYKLDIDLPFPVNGDDGNAKFDKAKHLLTITLPVSIPREEIPKYVKPDDVVTEEEEVKVKSVMIEKESVTESTSTIEENQKQIIEPSIVEIPTCQPNSQSEVPEQPKSKKSVRFLLDQEESSNVDQITSSILTTAPINNSSLHQTEPTSNQSTSLPVTAVTFKQYNIEFSNKYVFELD